MKLKRFRIFAAALRPNVRQNCRFGSTRLLLGASLITLVGQPVKAQGLYWDPKLPDVSPSGIWNATDSDFDNLSNLGGTDQVWIAGSVANFEQLVGGTVTIVGTQTVGGIHASAPGVSNWLLTGDSIAVQGAGTISASTGNTLTVQSAIDGIAPSQALDFTLGGGAVTVSGSIGNHIGIVTSDATLTLSGNNTFTGPLNVTSGTTTLAGGSAVANTSGLNLDGVATVVLGSSETVGALTGIAGTTISSGVNTLTAQQETNTIFAGAITGSSGFGKSGTGSLTLSGANSYTGVTQIDAGAIIATSNSAFGAAGVNNRTTVASGATVALQGGFSSSERFNMTGAGAVGFGGAIHNVQGNNTLNGQLTMTGLPATIHSESGVLGINGGVNSSVVFGQDILTFSATSGATIRVNSLLASNVEAIRKIGEGTLDLSVANQGYFNTGTSGVVFQTEIVDGTVVISSDGNLGQLLDGAIGGVQFNGVATNAPTLRITNSIDFEAGAYDRVFQVGGALGQIQVTGANIASIGNDDLSFTSATNILRKLGTGTLNITAVISGVGNVALMDGVLDPDTGTLNVLGAGFSGLNPTVGLGGIPLPGTTSLNLGGLGDALGGQTGTVNLGVTIGSEFDNILIDQSNASIFDGTLNTTGDLTVVGTGALQLSGANSIGGNVHVSGNQLIINSNSAVGDNTLSYDQRATFVWGQFNDPLVPNAQTSPGRLSLNSSVTGLDERITLVNNGRLDNLAGHNVVNTEVRALSDGSPPFVGIPGSDDAQIGATAGSLTLAAGLFSSPGQSINLNGLATDAGTVIIAGEIKSTVANVSMGNSANDTNTVVLSVANSYSGHTLLNGGNLIVGNNNALSGSDVTVNANTTIGSMGAINLSNDIALANTSTLTISTTAPANMGLNGKITGNGGITNAGGTNELSGTNSFTGATNVNGGTLNLLSALSSTQVNVAAAGTLTTSASEQLADTVSLIADGIVTLGGSETIATLKGAGTVNADANTVTLTNGGIFSGEIIGTGKTVLSGGSLTLNVGAGLNSTDLDIQFGSILTTTGAEFIGNDTHLNNDGTVNLGGDETVKTYTSTGDLNGPGSLNAESYFLNDGSEVNANITLGDIASGSSHLTTNGQVLLSGTSNVDHVTIESGSLNGNGALNYSLLEGNGTLNRSLTNTLGRTVNPGIGDGNIGQLTITGDFINQGNLVFDLNALDGAFDSSKLLDSANADLLIVNGSTMLEGNALVFNRVAGSREFNAGEKALVISGIGEITMGFFASFDSSDYLRRMFFDVQNGTVVGTGLDIDEGLGGLEGLTENQIAIAEAADFGISGGNILDDTLDGDKIALAIINDPQGAINKLSPESYAGMTDYGIQVTKAYTTAALNMPGTSIPGTSVGSTSDSDSKSAKTVRIPMGSRAQVAVPAIVKTPTTSVFGGFTHFDTASDSSNVKDHGDYEISSNGGIAGVRHDVGSLTLAGFVGIDQGDLTSATIDADADGFLLGAIASYRILPEMNLIATGGITYGSYDYDGDRDSLLGTVDFNADSDVFDVHFGIEGDAYTSENFSLNPFLQLHYITADTDGFSESGNGSALLVDGMDEDAFFAEIGLKAEYQVSTKFSVNGHVGYTHNFMDSDRQVSATLGGAAFTVNSPGLGEDFVTLGLGAQYQATENLRFGINYRAEFSNDADTSNGVSLGASYSF